MNESDGIGAYAQAWNEHDPAVRRTLLDRAWAPGATYCDPLSVLEGADALSDHIGGFLETLAGGRIDVTAEAVRHHDRAWFPWCIRDAGGTPVLSGFDAVELDGQGRITRLSGFFDDAAALSSAP